MLYWKEQHSFIPQSIQYLHDVIEGWALKVKVATSSGHLWQVHAVPPLVLSGCNLCFSVTSEFLTLAPLSWVPQKLWKDMQGNQEETRKYVSREIWSPFLSSEVITALGARAIGKFESFVSFSRVSSILLYIDDFVIHLPQLPHLTHPEWPSLCPRILCWHQG